MHLRVGTVRAVSASRVLRGWAAGNLRQLGAGIARWSEDASPSTMTVVDAMRALPGGLLDEITSRLVDEFQPEEVILFGSYAWGTPDDDSDIDLYVVVASSDEPEVVRDARAHRRLSGLRAPKDVLVRTRADYDRFRVVRASLEWRIEREGRPLHGPRRAGAGP